MEGHVGLGKIDPEADTLGQLFPFLRVDENRIDALADELLNPVLEDALLAGDLERLLDLDLHRQPVGVPARLARHPETAHGLVARENIFDDARQDVPIVGHAISGGRPLVENEGLRAGALLEAFCENLPLFPEGDDVRLLGGKVITLGYCFED